MPAKGSKKIDTVAAELVATQKAGRPACLILGAGASVASGVPMWEAFAGEVLDALGADGSEEGDSNSNVGQLEVYVRDNPLQVDLVVDQIDEKLRSARPSRGYGYLARLVQAGYYRTIITTNWDTLLEDALHQVLPSSELLVLTRDQVDEHFMTAALKLNEHRVVVLKLHGDTKSQLRMGEGLTTRSISRSVVEALEPRLKRVHLVGHSGRDLDVLQLLFSRVEDGDVLVASPEPTNIEETLRRVSSSFVGGETSLKQPARNGMDPPRVNIGEFDHFFCQLSLSIERRLLRGEDRQGVLKGIETALLRKEEVGLSYINSSQLTRMARMFVGQVTKLNTPDVVFFINDPSAPGGMELKKRIESDLMLQGIGVGVLNIAGEGDNRSFKRSFRGPDEAAFQGQDVKSVHILDSITFSGNTLRIAREKVQEWYPSAEIRLGALVVSQMLLDRDAGREEIDRIYYDSVTDRFEIFFPWGVTQTTADFDRTFPGVDHDRVVQITRRPWGAIEVLVDQELCSVRFLTIEAGRRLSFQRHLCRDELFIALDDNIGLDVCAMDLDPNSTPFDPSVKSMVLEKGDYILVSRGIWHRTKASMDRVRLLEVSFGVYDQQYDIERLFDDFDRTHRDGAE
jgi:mannose-6-phosphate isomerase